jgi:hypothetical protein
LLNSKTVDRKRLAYCEEKHQGLRSMEKCAVQIIASWSRAIATHSLVKTFLLKSLAR